VNEGVLYKKHLGQGRVFGERKKSPTFKREKNLKIFWGGIEYGNCRKKYA